MRERSFGPAVLGGLGGATLAAVASGRDWASARGNAAGVEVSAAVLVLRGRVRRAFAVVGALAAAGVLATVVGRFGGAQDDALDAVVAAGDGQPVRRPGRPS